MKFTDGYWSKRKGVQAFYPTQVYDIVTSRDAFTVYAPTKPVLHRGDMVDSTVLTVEFSTPLPDVIRTKLTHMAGQPAQAPHFNLSTDGTTRAEICDADDAVSLTSDHLTVRVPRCAEAWRVDFIADDHLLTSSGLKGMGIIEVDDEHYIHEQLTLDIGECVYGLGERFTPFVKNGQVVDVWNRDGGTNSDQAYKNVPFYLTNRGYGIFVNHPEMVSFEIGSENVSRVQFSVAGHSLEYFVIYGPTPKEILEKYTALTGRPFLPPPWSFGLWLSTSFTTPYNEETVTSFIQGMAERDLPLHVFHFDCFWMKAYHWCDFTWDEQAFPDPAGMLHRLKERGLHISLWINPYIAQRSPLFAEGSQHGYLLKTPAGTPWQTNMWQPGMGIVDFTNPDARQWFTDKLDALLDMGADCFKTDFGERIPTDVVYHDGSDSLRMHNYYPYLYNQTVFELLRKRRGAGEAVVFARSATVGSQKFPVHWGGDCEASFAAMAESLRGGLSLGLSGFGFWSHDIGGFTGTPSAAIYKRWIAFGLLSSHSRLHGETSYRVPWLFDEESSDVLRQFTQLKCQLMPYIYAHALEAAQKGTPLMRAMLLEFPDDPACDYLDRQYMLGDSLLVAPVFSEQGSVTYYVPAGRWTNFLTGMVVEGPGWVHETHDFMSLPLLVRPNSVIAFGNRADRPDYDYGDGVTLHVYELADGKPVKTIIPSVTGEVAETFTISRDGQQITATCAGAAKRWQLLLVGMAAVASAENATIEHSPQGVLIIPLQESTQVQIWLDNES
ncbi:MAG: alpha-xylosidase [Ardenticatenaceae bacterium]|nr:alpha-xylosidase [Ardenticatenaceae bacterium]